MADIMSGYDPQGFGGGGEFAGGSEFIDPELLKLLNQSNIPAENTYNPALESTSQITGGTPAPSMLESAGGSIVKSLQDYAPLYQQLGSTLMGGQSTVGGQVATILGQQASSAKLNEAMKKMILSQLGGGKSFSEGQMPTLSGAEVSGLTPEQITGLYGTAMKTRTEERAFPLAQMKAYGDIFAQITDADLKRALAERHLAEAAKIGDPVLRTLEMQKARAEISKIIAVTEKEVTEKAKTEAETRKIGLESDPAFTAFKKRLETEYGGKLEEVRLGNKVNLTNPVTGKTVLSYEVGPVPESGAGAKKQEHDIALLKFAFPQVAPVLVPHLEAEMAKLPGGPQKLKLQELISSLRGPGTGEIDPSVVKAQLSKYPTLLRKYEKAIDQYVGGFKAGLEEAQRGEMVQRVLGTPGKAAAPPGTPNKPTPVTSIAKPLTTSEAAVKLAGQKSGKYQRGDTIYSWDGTKIINIEKAAPSLSTEHTTTGGF